MAKNSQDLFCGLYDQIQTLKEALSDTQTALKKETIQHQNELRTLKEQHAAEISKVKEVYEKKIEEKNQLIEMPITLLEKCMAIPYWCNDNGLTWGYQTLDTSLMTTWTLNCYAAPICSEIKVDLYPKYKAEYERQKNNSVVL
ncbi:MAG: hypothetical protein JHC93_05865 [Parachlamydiales bacterium]|nr:hypothetical protein [Parachlamydiales bacterium]